MADLNFNLQQDAPSMHFETENAHVVTVPIDDTLTQEGAAADAKAVGDRFAALEADDIGYADGTVADALGTLSSDVGDLETALAQEVERLEEVITDKTDSIKFATWGDAEDWEVDDE